MLYLHGNRNPTKTIPNLQHSENEKAPSVRGKVQAEGTGATGCKRHHLGPVRRRARRQTVGREGERGQQQQQTLRRRQRSPGLLQAPAPRRPRRCCRCSAALCWPCANAVSNPEAPHQFCADCVPGAGSTHPATHPRVERRHRSLQRRKLSLGGSRQLWVAGLGLGPGPRSQIGDRKWEGRIQLSLKPSLLFGHKNHRAARARAWCQRIPACIRAAAGSTEAPASSQSAGGPEALIGPSRGVRSLTTSGGVEPSGTPVRSVRAKAGCQALFSGRLVPGVGPTLRSQPAGWLPTSRWPPSTGPHWQGVGKATSEPSQNSCSPLPVWFRIRPLNTQQRSLTGLTSFEALPQGLCTAAPWARLTETPADSLSQIFPQDLDTSIQAHGVPWPLRQAEPPLQRSSLRERVSRRQEEAALREACVLKDIQCKSSVTAGSGQQARCLCDVFVCCQRQPEEDAGSLDAVPDGLSHHVRPLQERPVL
ncbi:uncharacterized protein LOC118571872 [Onychomys torridus]|uniref:uncharacterized protein LOC118571872 n=1 Tax=Onychomys torridus TaxID=38674 RepID=UPI00167F6DC4|nr:uncharacterized protein LOC118571872 [Onychomys torridus]